MLLVKHETLSSFWAVVSGWIIGFAFLYLSNTFLIGFHYNLLLAVLIIAFIPLFYFLLWFLYGREKLAAAVGYYPTPPNPKREPWEIYCLIEGGECLESDLLKVVLFQLLHKGALDIDLNKKRRAVKVSFLNTTEKTHPYGKGDFEKSKELC